MFTSNRFENTDTNTKSILFQFYAFLAIPVSLVLSIFLYAQDFPVFLNVSQVVSNDFATQIQDWASARRGFLTPNDVSIHSQSVGSAERACVASARFQNAISKMAIQHKQRMVRALKTSQTATPTSQKQQT